MNGQSRLDAMNDAAQFRLALRERGNHQTLYAVKARGAALRGQAEAESYAYTAAHFAFHFCPGLR